MKCFTLKTIILGDCGVGKTTMLYKYDTGNFNNENNSTIGVNFVSKIVDNGQHDIKLQVWDTAGQERFRSIIRSYYHNVCGCIVVYDITNIVSFNNCAYWIDEVRKNNVEAKIILVGTKKDLQHERCVDYTEGAELSDFYNIPFFEISSKECVVRVFDNLVKIIIEHIYNNHLNIETMKGVVQFENSETYKNNKRGYDYSDLFHLSTYSRCCNR